MSKTETTNNQLTPIQEKLLKIQSELKAPKNRRNTFGNYNYRDAEGILEAVKPLLKQEGILLTISDDMVHDTGDNRWHVKAVVTLRLGEETITTNGFAREEETKKGMDGSQITGAASSYARKYALNGLFLIDDNKDSDSTNAGGDDPGKAKKTTPAKTDTETTAENPTREAKAITQPPTSGLKPIEVNTPAFTGAANWIAGTALPTLDAIDQLKQKYSFTPDVEKALAEAVGKIKEAK